MDPDFHAFSCLSFLSIAYIYTFSNPLDPKELQKLNDAYELLKADLEDTFEAYRQVKRAFYFIISQSQFTCKTWGNMLHWKICPVNGTKAEKVGLWLIKYLCGIIRISNLSFVGSWKHEHKSECGCTQRQCWVCLRCGNVLWTKLQVCSRIAFILSCAREVGSQAKPSPPRNEHETPTL